MRLMPTSITMAPGLIQSPLDHLRPADGGDHESARRHNAGRSRVREWAMVTVQFSRSSSCATGLPTRLERPTTTASRPDSEPSAIAAAASGSRAACRAPSAGGGRSPACPTLAVKPSTSLAGSIASMHLARCRCAWAAAAAPGCRDAVVGIEPRDEREHLGLGVLSPAGDARTSHAGFGASARPCCAHRPGSPDRRRRAPRRGRAWARARR